MASFYFRTNSNAACLWVVHTSLGQGSSLKWVGRQAPTGKTASVALRKHRLIWKMEAGTPLHVALGCDLTHGDQPAHQAAGLCLWLVCTLQSVGEGEERQSEPSSVTILRSNVTLSDHSPISTLGADPGFWGPAPLVSVFCLDPPSPQAVSRE